MMKTLNAKPLFLIVIVVSMLSVSCSDSSKQHTKSQAKSDKRSQTHQKKSRNPIAAPDFTLEKMNGDTFTLSDHKGQVVVLNVWATWCPPCRKEIPDFIEIQKKLRDEGVLFVGISVDKEGWEAVRPFAKEYGINYPLVLISNSFARKYGPFRAIPVTIIIDKKGNIAYAGKGRINTKSLKKVLRKMAEA